MHVPAPDGDDSVLARRQGDGAVDSFHGVSLYPFGGPWSWRGGNLPLLSRSRSDGSQSLLPSSPTRGLFSSLPLAWDRPVKPLCDPKMSCGDAQKRVSPSLDSWATLGNAVLARMGDTIA